MKRSAFIGCLLVFCLVLAGCSIQTTQTDPGEAAQEQASIPVTKAAKLDINSLPLVDDASLYRAYDPVDPICFYITVVGGNAADGTDHTFEEVNAYRNLQGMTNVEKIKTEIIFQVGDETGPRSGEVGYSAVGSNATMNVRGRTSTYYPQKSYRIDLYDTAGLWRGQRAIAINKHPGDHTRLRNMLYFEMLQDVPGLTSLRTQFVHVYINDRTDPANKNEFVDHGLYTQVELPNGRFLRNHGLSQNGNLYKANLNEMFRYEDKLRLATDPLYDIAAFSEILEPKTSQDHSKLLNMLDMLNDFSIPIEEVAQKHFNIDNLTSYLAFNLLMFNPDSNAQNYLLYSPVNSDCWYYICWDGDGAMSWYEDELLQNAWLESPWTRGVSNYWGVVLFNRLLRTQSFREALIDKVELLRTMITPERIAEIIKKYRATVDQFTQSMPDSLHMGIPVSQLELIYQNMPYDTDRAYENFIQSLTRPMPFYLGDAIAENGQIALTWEASFDFNSELLRYDVQIATDWSFEEDTLVYESLGQLLTQASAPMPKPGIYYWRAGAINESGNTQVAFDQVSTDTGTHGGMRRIEVTADGGVINLR